MMTKLLPHLRPRFSRYSHFRELVDGVPPGLLGKNCDKIGEQSGNKYLMKINNVLLILHNI